MIKKTTLATFKDGKYVGEYDWQGGIPLSVGETVNVSLDGEKLVYKLIDKSTDLIVGDDEQIVETRYYFELA